MRPTKAWHFGVIAILIAVNYAVLSTLKPSMDFHYDLGFWRCLGGFFTGVIVARVYRAVVPMIARWRDTKSVKRTGGIATLTEVLILTILVGFVIYMPGKAQFFIAPVAFIFVLGFAFDLGGVSRFMGSKPLRYLGRISYSIYMGHILISMMFSIGAEMVLPRVLGPLWNATMVGGDILLVPYLLLVITASHFTYKYIEVPGRKVIQAYDFGEAWARLKLRKNAKPA